MNANPPSETKLSISQVSGFHADGAAGEVRDSEEWPLDFPTDETLKSLLQIRHFELLLLQLFEVGRLSGTTHTCLGQEYIPVAVMPLLGEEDFIFSNHRGHGHYLARFDDPEGLLAEIMGKEGGICQGVGGSQHLRRGRFFSTGIQGQSLPVAVGAALQLKREARGAVSVPVIGDGTWGQGAVYEALNMAALWQAPLVLVVENNHIAQSTPEARHTAGTIEARVRAFGIRYLRCTGDDVAALRRLVRPEIEQTRRGGGPVVIEFDTQRLASHSKGDDSRDRSHVTQLEEASWPVRYRRQQPELFARAEEEAREIIRATHDRVALRPPAVWTPGAQ